MMTPSTDSRQRSRAPRQAASAVAVVLALATARLVAPTTRLLGVIGVLIVAVVVARRGARTREDDAVPAAPTPLCDPVGEEVGRLLEQGMGDLNRYLERHAAFAAYLASREGRRPSTAPGHPSSDGSPPGRCSPVGGSRPL